MYAIAYASQVAEDLADLRAFERKRLLDRIEEQLQHEPNKPTRNKKEVVGLVPPWDTEDPTWELRSGEYRIFYDVDEHDQQVTVRAIRRKPSHKTTEEIL
jgi:mRNA-degrading endonuclease RelE of RelBE toxin-antitoxin system